MPIPIRSMNNTALKMRGRVADALRGLAAALTDSFALRRPKDAPQVESFDGAEAGAVTDAAALLRDDELHRESDRHGAARHAEHQALARWRHAAAVDRARSGARRGSLPAHQAARRAGRARDRALRESRLARRVGRRGQVRAHSRAHVALVLTTRVG